MTIRLGPSGLFRTVGAWRAPPSRVRSLSSSAVFPMTTPIARTCLPRVGPRVSLPALWAARWGSNAPPPLAVQALWPADLGDRGDGDAQDAHAARAVVLGGLPGGDAHAGDLGAAASAPAWDVSLRDGVADAPEAAPGDGRLEREPLKREVEVDETPSAGAIPSGVRAPARWQGAGRRGRRCAAGARVGFACRCFPTRARPRPVGQGDSRPGAVVHTDGRRSAGSAAPAMTTGLALQRRRQHDEQKLLPRAHRASSNLKTWLQGTHRGVSPEHLQVYLDEHVFRHNRRRALMAAFQTLLGLEASTSRRPTTRSPGRPHDRKEQTGPEEPYAERQEQGQ